MSLLLTAATEKELEPLFSKGSVQQLDAHLWEWRLDGFPVIHILFAGIGTASTVLLLTKVLHKYPYRLVIQAGICGAYDRNLSQGDVVFVSNDCFGQLGAEDDHAFISTFEMGLMDADKPPFVNGKLIATTKIPTFINRIPSVNGVSVETVLGNEISIQKMIDRLNPQTESMEGAAFYFTCNSLQVPAIQIRSISNYVEKRNKANWNIQLAVQNLNAFLLELLPTV